MQQAKDHFTLVDDGTMDTVFVCEKCSAMVRTNPEPPLIGVRERNWDRVAAGLEIAQEHECNE